MIYVTGDTHGSYRRLRRFFNRKPVGKDDILIVLGDTGLNYYGDDRDVPHRKSAARLPLTLLCLRGNHDRHPASLPANRAEKRFGGLVYADEQYPDVLFAEDGEIYCMEGKSVLTIGGAYSIDKQWRLQHGYNWFSDEQISSVCMRGIEDRLAAMNWQVDTVLTHTCPLRYEPVEAFYKHIDQSGVDKRMEVWLDSIEERLSYRQWLCGHFHIDKQTGKVRFLYRDVTVL